MILFAEFLKLLDKARVRRPSSPSTPGIVPGAPATLTISEGDSVQVTAAAISAGLVVATDKTGVEVGRWNLSAGQKAMVGARAGGQTVVITCTAGSIDAVVGDAVLGAPQSAPFGGLTSPDGSALTTLVPQLTKIYLNTAKALGKVPSNPLLVQGDSLWVSAGSGTGPLGLVDAAVAGAIAVLVDLLNKAGVPTANDSFFGDMLLTGNGVAYSQYDPRFSTGGGATVVGSGAAQSLGGVPWQLNAANKSVSFTPSNPVDTAEFYLAGRRTGSVDCNFAGGASLGVTATTGTQLEVVKVTKTFPRGTGTFTISWASGDNWVLGAIFKDSTTPRLNLVNLSCYGDRLTSVNGVVYNSTYPELRGGKAMAALAPVGVITEMVTNSQTINGLAGVDAFGVALGLFCDDVAATGAEAVIMVPHRISTGDASDAVQNAYAAEQYRVAAARSKYTLDFSKKISSYTAFQPLFFDSKHLGKPGAAAKAAFVLPIILQR